MILTSILVIIAFSTLISFVVRVKSRNSPTRPVKRVIATELDKTPVSSGGSCDLSSSFDSGSGGDCGDCGGGSSGSD